MSEEGLSRPSGFGVRRSGWAGLGWVGALTRTNKKGKYANKIVWKRGEGGKKKKRMCPKKRRGIRRKGKKRDGGCCVTYVRQQGEKKICHF